MLYNKIFGWFSFAELYDKTIEESNDGDIFVEVGSYLGKSAAYMAEQIKNSGKKIKFYAIDIWESSQDLGDIAHRSNEVPNYNGKHIFDVFLQNLKPLKDYLVPLRIESVYAAEYFDNEELKFCYIDAQHDYENVKADLNAWFPKMSKGSIMAGHDYHHPDWPGVTIAVDEFFGARNIPIEVDGISWIVRL